MIIKLRFYPDEWQWIDGVRRVHSYGQLHDVSQTPQPDHPEPAIPSTIEELSFLVDKMWGDHREFSYEVWPEFSDATKNVRGTVTCVRVEHHDGRVGLVLVADQGFLLGDDGSTIDRLR